MTETKKTDTARYDRQLRLWGEEGQELVESAHLALLNATGTGTETLKNLVLPGIGNFTIIDGENVTEEDLGNNFFVTVDSVGKSRAETTCALLQELNPLTKGHFVNKNPVELIEKDINTFKQFTHIVANSLPQGPLLTLSKFCWENNIPLVVERSYGFVGYLRVLVPEHTIVESKPDNPPDDLRLAEPFEELNKYVESFELNSMDSTDHSHTPYIIILLKAINEWKATHGGQLPSSRPEKEAFKSMVIKGSRNAQEENFNEAYRAAHKSFAKATIPSAVQNILKDKNVTNITANSTKFWILASALKGFVDNEGGGLLPLMGTIPDMTAGTNGYIALQKVYQDKSNADISAVQARVKNILQSIGKPETFISYDEIKKFCKNALFLQVVRYRSLEEEFSNPKSNLFASEDLDVHLSFYVALRAVDEFYAKHKRYPGVTNATVEADVTEILKDSADLVKKLGATKFNNDHIVELVQYGGVELHNMASLLGGVASQEVIKIVTHQYSPIDNTFIFNGLNSSSAVYSL